MNLSKNDRTIKLLLTGGVSSLLIGLLQGAFKVHWGISIPHFIIFLVCTIAVVRLIRTKTGTGE